MASDPSLPGLPPELQTFVIQDLSIGDLGRLAQTSTLFKDFITPVLYSRDNNATHPRAILWAASVDPASVRNEDVMTVLDLAIRYGGDLNRTYGPTASQNSYYTPLHLAAARGNLPVVKKLLDHGAHPNALGKRYLYNVALSLNHEEFDERMGRMNQSLVVFSRFSLWRPLFVPFVLKHDEIIQALLEKGASPVLAVVDPDREGSASETGNINILHILASQKGREYTDATGRSYFERYSNLINVPVPNGYTPLTMTLDHDNISLFRHIFKHGGDIGMVNALGISPLVQTIKRLQQQEEVKKRKRYISFIHYLVEKCNVPVSNTGAFQTPLSCIIEGLTNDSQKLSWRYVVDDVSSIVNLLLRHGADVNEVSQGGRSLLLSYLWILGQRKKRGKNQMDSTKLLDFFKSLVNDWGADVNARFDSITFARGSSLLGNVIIKFNREPLPFFQTLLELNAKLAPDEINPIFRMWVEDIRLRNTKPAFDMLEYSQEITQDSIDFAYRACLNGREPKWEKLWGTLQSHFPDSTVPQQIAAEALIQDADIKRFNMALTFKNFDGSYTHTGGNSFLHLITRRLKRFKNYTVSQAIDHSKALLKLNASVTHKNLNGTTALDRLIYMHINKADNYDPLRVFLYKIEHAQRVFREQYQDGLVSKEAYEKICRELIDR